MADEMDDASWELLNGPGVDAAQGETGRALGMLVKMTRLHDLGLAQLCFNSEEAEFLTSGEHHQDILELDSNRSELEVDLALQGLVLLDGATDQ